jgi:pimeloyl-ACP methyl ester carboxylesterase
VGCPIARCRDSRVDDWIGDLESVVEAVGVERFALLGISQGAAIAIAYAVRHPERVSHLILYGGYVRGRRHRGPQGVDESRLPVSVIRLGWGQPHSAFRRVFTNLFLPEGTPEQVAWYDELQRTSSSPEMAARQREARDELEVTALAGG